MIVEKQMECSLAGETEVLGENLPQLHFCPSQNPTRPDPITVVTTIIIIILRIYLSIYIVSIYLIFYPMYFLLLTLGA
jgi:hypothetical protein